MKIAIITRSDTLEKKNRVFVNETYIQKIIAYGHTPILLYGIENLDEMATFCDALIIPGGYDIAPYFFNQTSQSNCIFYKDKTQDIRDFAILDAFVRKAKPILGICRGIQLINVYFHGSLHQDIDIEKHTKKHMHQIVVNQSSFLASCMPATATVNSYHHQVIAKLGNDLQACATSQDGYIEAIEHKTLPIIGVQWHPEIMEDDFIFPYFFYSIKHTLS